MTTSKNTATEAEPSGATFTMPIQNHARGGKRDESLNGPFVWVPTAADRQQAQTNHFQSLERLAQRGGMSWCEMAAIVLNKRWQKFEQAYAKAICRDVLIMRARQGDALQNAAPPADGPSGLTSGHAREDQ